MATLKHNASDIDNAIDSVGTLNSNVSNLNSTVNSLESTMSSLSNDLDTLESSVSQMILKIYPVGAIYISTSSTSPASLFGGTWSQIQNRFLLAAGSSYTAGNTGGASTVTLTTSQIPSHRHEGAYYMGDTTEKNIALNSGSTGYRISWTANGGSGNAEIYTKVTGGGGSHTNMPPYLVVYVWKRTA